MHSRIYSLTYSLLIQTLAADWDLKKEASWVVTNAIHGGSPEQIVYLASTGVIITLFQQAQALLQDQRIESQLREAAVRITALPQAVQNEKRLAKQFLSSHPAVE